MVRIISLVIALAFSLLVGGGAFALDQDKTRDRDKTVLHDQDRLKTQDRLYTQDKNPTKDMIRDRDRDKLHTPGGVGTNQGSRTGAGAGGRR
jgi:hypothetical protein